MKKLILRVIAIVFITSCLSSQTLAVSTIVNNETNFVKSSHLYKLEQWLGQGSFTLENIYTKSAGDRSAAFHRAADGQGPTFTLMKITDGTYTRIVGGYNPQSWHSGNSFNYSTAGDYSGFIFNLSSSQIWRQISNQQTYNNSAYGPTFGGGHDIYVNNAMDTGYSYSLSYGTASAKYNPDLMGSPGQWSILELEVFKFHDSRIIDDNTNFVTSSHLDQLQSWLGEGAFTLHNIYTKSAGDNSLDFHSAVDGKGRTFTIMKLTDGTTTRTIGGYNPHSWRSDASYNRTLSPRSFIFNLTDNMIWRQSLDYQCYNHPSYGPTFGGGHDIKVNADLDSGYSYSHSYGTPTSSFNPDLLGNDGDWTILEMEVFAFAESSVVGDQSDMMTQDNLNQLDIWLGQGSFTLKRIYTKSFRDTSLAFHSAVNGQGPTFTIMKISKDGVKRIIGGYNPLSWSSVGAFNLSASTDEYTAFIFNLTDSMIWRQTNEHQTYNHPSYGPTFGSGHDIKVNSDLNSGYSYSLAYGTATSSYNQDLLGSPNDWSIDEIEVYAFFECTYDLTGDANNDCRVDLIDFALLASNWMVDCATDDSDLACIPE